MDCNECTLCCKLLKIKETDSIAGKYCQFCHPVDRCIVYETRPESCQIFECAWKQMDNAGEELRPDKCGVLFEKWSDKVIIGATDVKLSELILNQISYFNNEGISILIINHSEKSRTFYLSSGHTKQFVRDQINDSAKLHRRLN